ncbi:hypothetical protein [Candidatus Bathycorpusculum sp.]|jgi:hypothetical protein|uniref:hypothetical protein n=1 Tax=Candidatus Bathycorpusculum sp. TaxID=2994959 RepID=UPI002832DB7F|nr:hypothetical protein [Candidatus Termitimicrobium sp.]
MFKWFVAPQLLERRDMGESRGKKSSDKTPVQTIVVLNRNTTWRCGKLEKSIVNHLYKRHKTFGRPGVSVKDILLNLDITGENTDNCLDALRRLEKRNIVTITAL